MTARSLCRVLEVAHEMKTEDAGYAEEIRSEKTLSGRPRRARSAVPGAGCGAGGSSPHLKAATIGLTAILPNPARHAPRHDESHADQERRHDSGTEHGKAGERGTEDGDRGGRMEGVGQASPISSTGHATGPCAPLSAPHG